MPLKQPKVQQKDYDENDMANLQKKKDEEHPRHSRKDHLVGGGRTQEEWKEMRAFLLSTKFSFI
uniref:Uncharacterized protein n=1 Tax=Kalanchoe fedtschenkoi TaxID=63787 RepID=A0A7N0VGC2_KALFE